MINIVYCQTHNIVLSAGKGEQSASHFHGDIDEHGKRIYVQGTVIENIDEKNYINEDNFVTKDGSIISSSDEWLVYLEKYII